MDTAGAVTQTSGNTTTGMNMTIASFGTETNVPAAVGNMGKPTFTFDLIKLLPNGGRFSIKITHNNGA